jgi:predicted DsbA family dithiol-disulfide isomerase
MASGAIQVEIWSDVVCPWCYIGKRRFERAVEQITGDVDVATRYRAYQLDPTASPGRTMPVAEAYARKFGGPERAQAMIDRVTEVAAAEGLEFRLDRAQRANTLLAHRLIWRAAQPDSPVGQAVLKERLLRAYFHDGLDIGDPVTLAECAADVGIDRASTLALLDSDTGRDEVADELRAAADAGITAVPTYVINGVWAVPGAQDSDTFVTVLRRVSERMRDG